jgi:3'(2'), 5'-bisphosphate nucleotidase
VHDRELLEIIIAAALEAGGAAHEIFRGDHQLAHKKDNSPVTAADHAAEAIILKRLGAHLAHIPIIAEEEVAAGRVPVIGSTFFLVDPLDGTREFIAHRPEFTVNIALIHDGAPTLGVVYAPAMGELFGGDVAGGHAFRAAARRGQLGRRSCADPRAARATWRADGGRVALASEPKMSEYLAGYEVAETVSIGSSLKFCLVAQGRADLYPRLGTRWNGTPRRGMPCCSRRAAPLSPQTVGRCVTASPDFPIHRFVAAGSRCAAAACFVARAALAPLGTRLIRRVHATLNAHSTRSQ